MAKAEARRVDNMTQKNSNWQLLLLLPCNRNTPFRSKLHPEGIPWRKKTSKQKLELYIANRIVKNVRTAIQELQADGIIVSVENPCNSLPLSAFR